MQSREIKILDELGPTLTVFISPSKRICDWFEERGMEVPYVEATAMIDTGTTYTGIHQNIVDALKLESCGVQTAETAGGDIEQFVYDVRVTLQGMDSVFYTTSPCVNLNPKKFEVIIGRDILNRGTFLYKGLEQYYVIGFKPGVYGLEDY